MYGAPESPRASESTPFHTQPKPGGRLATATGSVTSDRSGQPTRVATSARHGLKSRLVRTAPEEVRKRTLTHQRSMDQGSQEIGPLDKPNNPGT